jgi:hypothetical protein
MSTIEEQYDRLLKKLQQDPQFELRQELGQFLLQHIDSLTPEERKRYDELIELLNQKQ